MPAGSDLIDAHGAHRDDDFSVVVFVAHRAVRELILELLRRAHGRWTIRAVANAAELTTLLALDSPDVLVVDAGDFPDLCRESLRTFPPARVVVIGPEPDAGYELAAVHSGAGAWLPRERIAEDLDARLQAVLGCTGRWDSRKRFA